MSIMGVRNGDKGIALAITLLIMALLLLVGIAFLGLSSTETQIAFNERDGLQAFYLAEAGVERAIAELNANPNYTGTGGEVAFASGTYTVTLSTPAGSTTQRVINATGCLPNCAAVAPARKQIQVTVERTSPFRWAIFGDRSLALERVVFTDSYNSDKGPYGVRIVGGSPPVNLNIGSEGDTGSNGDISLESGVVIRGDVIASGDVQREKLIEVTGQIIEGEVNRPLVPLEKTHCDLAREQQARLKVGEGEVITIGPGTYYYDRIGIERGAVVEVSGETRIFIDGGVEIHEGVVIGVKPREVRGKVTRKGVGEANSLITAAAPGKRDGQMQLPNIPPHLLQPPTLFAINACSEAAVHLERGVVFSGVIYAPNAPVRLREAVKVYGSVIGKEVKAYRGVFVHYDEALKGKLPGRFRPVAGSWQERFPLDGNTPVAVGSSHPTSPSKTGGAAKR